MPLQVMLEAMEEELRDPEGIASGRSKRNAFKYAEVCAPFFHAKPVATQPVSFPDASAAAAEIMAMLREANKTVPKA